MRKQFTKMLKCVLFLSFILNSLHSRAQDEETKDKERADSIRKADYDRFIGKVLNAGTLTPQASLTFDVTKSPELALTYPIARSGWNYLHFNGKIGSNNDFTPLVKNGKWAPNTDASIFHTYFIKRGVKFYRKEIPKFGTIAQAPLNEASQLKWVWINTQVGYNYSEYIFFTDNGSLANNQINEKYYRSGFFRSNLNFYLYPSKAKTPGLTLTGGIGYEFKMNDNNYNSLKSVTIKSSKTYTDAASGERMEIYEEENKAKIGNFKVANSHNINYNLSALLAPKKPFYIGFNVYGRTKFQEQIRSTDLGTGINIPVTKVNGNERTLINFTLKYEVIDAFNEVNRDTPIKDKGTLGFAIGVPITTLHY